MTDQQCAHTWRRVAFPPVKLEPHEVMWLCVLCKARRIVSQWREADEVEEHGRVVTC